ncbi:alpha/beta hydrolase fold domain-containing protein [Ferruginibacter sp.]
MTKTIAVVFAALFIAAKTQAQLLSGLTGITDTTFSNRSAFAGAKKQYPDISLPTVTAMPAVSIQYDVTYNKTGKRSLKLDAFYPKEKKENNHIAIIMIYGGGWRSGNKTQHHALAQQLAAKGYVCFTPEYRLSTEALFPAAVYDLKAAIRWVREHAASYNIDTNKIVTAGFSAGGELASFLATTGDMPLFEGVNAPAATSSKINALVNIDGTLSFVHAESSETTDTSSRIGGSTYWFGYTQKENFKLMEAGSPLTFAGPRTPPSLFINSSIARMHAGRDDFTRILESNHIYTEVHTFPNTPHTFCLFEPWFTPTVNYIDAFS